MLYKTTIVAALAVLAAGPVLAHVAISPARAPAASTFRGVVQVPHGCDGQPTLKVAVALPEGIYAVQPMPKAGWTLETVAGDYAAAYDSHGTVETSGVRRIVWTGELPDAYYDEFVFRGRIGPDVAPETVLYFPVVQTCANGAENWTEIPAAGAARPANQAPGVTVDAAEANHHH